MKKSAKHFRESAWTQLTGNWTSAVIFTLVYFAIVFVVGVIGEIPGLTFLSSNPKDAAGYAFIDILLSLLLLFVTYPLAYSFMVAILNFKRTGENVKPGMLFDGFKDIGRIFLTNFLCSIFIGLWTMLLIVPGIIKAISYSQTNFILKDYPELQGNAAIDRSMAMMKGHKMEYFLLTLSFIGWIILGVFTFGIGFLWIYPYITTAYAHFYEYVKEDYEHRIAA